MTIFIIDYTWEVIFMPLEAVTQKISLNSRGSGETVQILTEGDMIVPDINPDIYQILKTDEDVVIDSVRAEQGRICFTGRLIVSVLYYGRKTEEPISYMKAEFPIDDCISADGVTEDTDADVTAEIIHTDYRLVNDRKVNMKAVTSAKASWTNQDEKEVLTSVQGGSFLQSLTGEINPGKVTERTEEEFTVRDELKLPPGKPGIAQILETTADICHREIRFGSSQAQIRGDFDICVIYLTSGDGPAIESAEFTLPFSGSVEVPESDGENYYIVRMEPVKIKAETASDENGEPRVIDMEITVDTVIKSFGSSTQTILEDAYSLSSPLKIDKTEADYIELCGRNRAQGTYRGTAALEEGQPDIMQIVKAWGNLRNSASEAGENKVTASGTADIKLMYIAKDDEKPLNMAETSIPYTQEIEIRGAEEGMTADVTAEIEDISVSLLSEREAEIRLVISFDTVVCESRKCSLICGIEETEEEDGWKNPSGAVIYTVKKGDTLWEIAKKYNTTVDDIMAINGDRIEDKDMIYPGQRLLILKKFV